MKTRNKLIGLGSIGVLSVVGIALIPNDKSSEVTDASINSTATVVVDPTTTVESTTTTTAVATNSTTVITTTTVEPTTTTIVALTVTHVVDGDTIDLSDGTTVRMIGIDTPEKGQCGYKEATQVLTDLVLNKVVTLATSANTDDKDKYGRLLRYVYVDGVDANAYMIQSGRAIARYDSRDGYGRHDHEDEYVALDVSSTSTNVCEAVTTVASTSAPTAPASSTLPQQAPPSSAVVATTQPIVVETTQAPVQTQPPAPPAEVYYANCDAARAAGASPLYAGQPGYRSGLDRDGDGVACE